MAERMNRGHNKLKPWERLGSLAAVVALGTAAIAGCASETVAAGHGPDRPAASASATPGSSESSPAPSESASTSPEKTKSFEMGETVLTNSTVYNELSELGQTDVEKNAQLSFMDFEKLPLEERAMVALVLSDAHSKEYLDGVKTVVQPGNYGKSMGEILSTAESYIPKGVADANGKVNAAQDLYYWTLSSTPEDVTASNNGQPYFMVQFERAIAGAMASTGNPKLLEDAKKIMGGSLYHGSEGVANASGPAYDVNEWGHLTERINSLRAMSETKTDTLKYLGVPDAGTNRHYFVDQAGGPSNVTLGFQIYNPDTQSMEDGVNSDGAGAAAYHDVVFKDKDGRSRFTWVESETTASPDGIGIGVLVPNSTK